MSVKIAVFSLSCATVFAMMTTGCARAPESAAPRDEHGTTSQQVAIGAVDHEGPEAKATAPVDVELKSSGRAGVVTATFSVRARADLPKARARFVVPDGVRVVRGDTEVDLGGMAVGERKEITLVLEVPPKGSFTLAAGVDTEVRGGLKLHKSEALVLGADVAVDPTKVVQLPGGGGVRVAK